MEKQKSNIVLLHGRWPEKINDTLIIDIPLCDPNNEGDWMGWTKKHLEEKGYSVVCPIVKDVWKAPYVEWKKELDKVRASFLLSGKKIQIKRVSGTLKSLK